MTKPCTLPELIDFIRENQGIARNKPVLVTSYLEKDLGITGDDGSDLLEAIEERYNITFTMESLGLSKGQGLFHSEGMRIFQLIASLFGRDSENVKDITVGDLYIAICQADWNSSRDVSSDIAQD